MIVEFSVYDTEAYSVEHLFDSKENFEFFVLPIVKCMAKYIGVNSLYIYALPEQKLIEHYGKMGFSRLPPKQERFVQHHVKPKYDEGCIFMYQVL